jgi:hypothetical protein
VTPIQSGAKVNGMASEETVRQLKNDYSAILLKTPGVCGVGVEKDEAGGYVLTVHLSADTTEVRESVIRCVGGVPLKWVNSGPFTRR